MTVWYARVCFYCLQSYLILLRTYICGCIYMWNRQGCFKGVVRVWKHKKGWEKAFSHTVEPNGQQYCRQGSGSCSYSHSYLHPHNPALHSTTIAKTWNEDGDCLMAMIKSEIVDDKRGKTERIDIRGWERESERRREWISNASTKLSYTWLSIFAVGEKTDTGN